MSSRPKLTINPEFHNFLPPLIESQRATLEKLILRDGCRDSIKVWTGPDGKLEGARRMVIDGHNRYEICNEKSKDYEVEEVPGLESVADVLQWMHDNQDGRRSWTRSQAEAALGAIYNARKLEPGRPAAASTESNGKAHDESEAGEESAEEEEESVPQRTAEAVAEEHGVSPTTVKKAGRFAEVMDKLSQFGCDDLRAAIMNHQIKKTDADIKVLAECNRDTCRKVQTQARAGINVLHDAMKGAGVQFPRKKKAKSAKASGVKSLKEMFDSLKACIGQARRLIDSMVSAQEGETNHSRSTAAKCDALSTASLEWRKAAAATQKANKEKKREKAGV